MNRGERLLAMLSILQFREIITADELASNLHISTRQVYNDIEALKGLHILVHIHPGTGNIFIRGQLIPAVTFTREETVVLEQLQKRLDRASSGSVQASMDKVLLTALDKINMALSHQQSAKAVRLISQNRLIIPAALKPPLFDSSKE